MTTQAAEAQRERIRHKILVVEDEADIRELLRYNLAQEGFAVEEAGDGADADNGGDNAKRGTVLVSRECRHGGKAKIIGFFFCQPV